GGWNDGTSGAFPDTLTATWNQPENVARAVVYTLDSQKYPASRYGIRDGEIQAYLDGEWHTLAQFSGNTDGVITRSFPPIETKALRLVVRASNNADYSRVVELEAYS
ncbi:MAG: discoidin domain-containing protein, partial [Sciscionella sp.]